MALNLGIAQIPTPGDAVNFVESTLGNVVEGIIEGVTGSQVELTPGNGVDNSKATGPSGAKADVKFDKKLVAYDDFERIRKEVEKELRETSKRVSKLQVELKTLKNLQQAPQGWGFAGGTQGWMGQQNPSQFSPLTLLALAGSDNFKGSPFLPILLMQSLSSMSFGRVGPGGQLQVDIGTVMMAAFLFSELGSSSRSQVLPPAPSQNAPGATGSN